MPRRKRSDPKPKFNVGDRVMGKPNTNVLLSRSTAMRNTIRVGAVVEVLVVVNKRNTRCFYYSVLWDGHTAPSTHAGYRLAFESERDQVLDNTINAIGN
jgi:hypothetical protein